MGLFSRLFRGWSRPPERSDNRGSVSWSTSTVQDGTASWPRRLSARRAVAVVGPIRVPKKSSDSVGPSSRGTYDDIPAEAFRITGAIDQVLARGTRERN
jgi:hypothetical protein